jgi:hypothetical protein
MSLTLTPLASDNFAYSSENLPNPPWTAVFSALFANAGICEASGNTACAEEYTGISSPDDQYASLTIQTFNNLNEPEVALYIRSNSEFTAGYKLLYVGAGFLKVFLLQSGSFEILSLPSVPAAQPGDVLTFAAVGTTLYVLYNGTVIGSVVDNTYASGGTGMFLDPDFITDVAISNFTTGSAAVVTPPPPPSNLPFLGSVRVVSNAPAGIPSPFLGTVKVVDSVPSGIKNPYLGNVLSVGSAPSGAQNPTIGEVVIVTDAPIATDPFLGEIVES